MLLSINQSSHQLWQQKQQRLSQLSLFSNQSVLEPITAKQIFHQKITDFINEQCFDSVLGGIIQVEHEQYKKPALANLYLGEILIAADRVFYDGIFSNIAEKITNYFFYNCRSNQAVALNQLDGFVKTQTLKSILNHEELILLDSLVTTKGKQIQPREKYDGMVISYSRSLRDAAKNIHMHFKQAQIIEESLLNKLKKQLLININQERQSPLLGFDERCQLVVSLSQLLLLKPNTIRQQRLLDGYQELLSRHKNNRDRTIRLIYSGIILSQINFDLALITQLAKLFEGLIVNNEKEVLSDEMKYQLEVAVVFFESAYNSHLNLTDEVDTNERYKVEINSNIRVFFLAKDDPRTTDKIVELRSSYYPNQFVFAI